MCISRFHDHLSRQELFVCAGRFYSKRRTNDEFGEISSRLTREWKFKRHTVRPEERGIGMPTMQDGCKSRQIRRPRHLKPIIRLNKPFDVAPCYTAQDRNASGCNF